MRSLLFFTPRELVTIAGVGLATGLVDHQTNALVFAVAGRVHDIVLLNDYLAFKTGGPVFGDLLQTWLEYGGVLAACLVRKPAAATLALTINGFCQVFVYGTHDPHLWYGVAGLGADLVFALFRYGRFDARTILLAGATTGMFWYCIVWFTHGIYLYPPSFIVSDLLLRASGTAVGDGLLGGGLAYVIITLARRPWAFRPSFRAARPSHQAILVAAGVVALGALVMLVTYLVPGVSSFFLSIAPKIPAGNPLLEEYNLGYVLGVLDFFLVSVMLAFAFFAPRYDAF